MESIRFPSAHTCYNQLDIPAYKLYKLFQSKLDQALNSMDRKEAFVEAVVIREKEYKKSRKAINLK